MQNNISADAEAAFDKGQRNVGEDGQQRGGDGAGENDGIADHGDSSEDKCAEAAGADGRGDGGDSNGDDRGGANAGKNDRQGQRQAHAREDLRIRHAHGFGGFAGRRHRCW